ncbi:Ricin B lectin [Chthoniobacter flavus Ellin428]|uniref:Ricin B lectin n=1 Tax=Chthoniobacter flavus Ellin428 TaxID=497964 RepID=B4CYT0_9BACT|nr:RICIN domain-containing protein [Chthoniobacter flavus]EDY20621.1 Ricin B lectin [Chthoniobacter flavus Ellin428]TCO89872.1 alginate lyase [Chthoniobacter flavus]
MKQKNSILTAVAFLLLLTLGLARAQAYTYPCIPATLDDLATLKASLNQEPWKSGYAALAADSHSSLNYTMQGPFATVTRNPDSNLWPWRNDMIAVFNLARMWYFTGNTAYAQKAHDILLAWANTQTSFGGQESGLDLGDYAFRYAGGASILRGTWPGWTPADTTTVQNYFLNVFWPACSASGNTPGEANKGSLNMVAGMAIAVFCDDTAKFDHVIDVYRTYPGSGLPNNLPTGEMGETGRDAGHCQGDLLSKALLSEIAWKQGVDLFSELDNRLLACGEYYARNTLALDNPFVPYGTVDYTYYVNAAGSYTASRSMLYIIQNAYKNRRGLLTPWIDRKLEQQPVDMDNWMYAKTADFTTATPLPAIVRPAVSLASSGLTLTTLGTQTAGSSASYANNVWTVSGLGNGVWNATGRADDCQFVYQAMTGDCALVGQVTSFTSSGTQNGKCGLMLRDNLSPTVSERGWIGVTWQNSTTTNLMECRQDGWTENWGGAGWSTRSQVLPPGLPYWLKIERRGNLVTTYSSQDGTSWAPIISSYYDNLPSTVYIGMFISSGTTTANTATFAAVAFTGGGGGLAATPPAPAAVFADGSSKAITVRWLPSFGATAYDVLRSTTSGSGYTVIASNLGTATTSYVDTTVATGTTYYYVVRAKNSIGTSGNSPEFGDSLLPSPMVNLAFSGVSSAFANSGAGTQGSDQAFNRNPGSKWVGSSPTGWIQYDFGAGNAQVVKRYTINSGDVPASNPTSWNFCGSQDGVNWTTLDSQSNQSFADWFRVNTYNIGNTTAFRYYQLQITANNGDTTVQLSELGLWGDSGQTIPNGIYRVVSRKSNKVLDVANGGTADGTDAVQWGWSDGNSQKWTITHLGNGQYQAVGLASGKLLEVTGASTADGAIVQIWPSNNNNCQKWTVIPVGDGAYKFLNVNSGKAADVSSGSTADGAAVIQWPYHSGDNQQWTPSLTIGTTAGSLVHQWKFDETSGTTAADSVSIGATPATLAAGATWTAGKVNNAVSLNGTSTSYVSYPNGFINTLGDFTIVGWFKLNSVSSWARIFDIGWGTSAYMFLAPSNGTNIRYAITTSGGAGEQRIDGTSIPSTGVWHHFAVTLSGTLGILYVDGVEVGRNSNMTLQPSNLGNTPQNYVGKSQFNDPYLNGLVDDLRIYNYGLSASEVSALAQ